jgi:hypothetical protein
VTFAECCDQLRDVTEDYSNGQITAGHWHHAVLEILSLTYPGDLSLRRRLADATDALDLPARTSIATGTRPLAVA